ncbi:MAG: YafY family protein [Thermoanaerobaculia bacterium]|nr:YafY family protein [Thermoanaerobaculia bacterium]
MSRPTSRLLATLEILQAHGQVSGPFLAERLGVDVRTIRRYVAALEELGIPLTAEAGRNGGYALVAGFRLPPLMFSNDEALALSLGLTAADQLGIGDLEAGLESARAKLERVLPAALRSRIRARAGALRLAWPRAGSRVPAERLRALEDATEQGRTVVLVYLGRREERTRRRFDGYGLVFRGGHWYAAGYCHLRQDVRTFRVDRIEALETTLETFHRPAGFDVLEQVTRAIAAVPRRHDAEVFLHCDLETARGQIFGAFGLLAPESGGTRLLLQAEDLAWLARELARLAVPFEIRRPEALRAALAGHLAQLTRAVAGEAGTPDC